MTTRQLSEPNGGPEDSRDWSGNTRSAFTLVELLVVIGIIGVLVAILLPALSRVRETANAAVCKSNLRQMGLAMQMYADNNRNWYPRALPLVFSGNSLPDWNVPWPHTVCPLYWQSCYPASILPYIGVKVSDPFDYPRLPAQISADRQKLFRCPSNQIAPEDLMRRKCGFPLDYGLANWASQNHRSKLDPRRHFLAADMTWALGFVPDSGGPETEPALRGWWVAFVHRSKTCNVLMFDQSVQSFAKAEFIATFKTDAPPADDPL
jgi:prepilin-type N-terminal cleavage/methylation domain-containing protein